MVDYVFEMKRRDSFDEMNSTMFHEWETAPMTLKLPRQDSRERTNKGFACSQLTYLANGFFRDSLCNSATSSKINVAFISGRFAVVKRALVGATRELWLVPPIVCC